MKAAFGLAAWVVLLLAPLQNPPPVAVPQRFAIYPVTAVAADPSNPNAFFVGTSLGVQRTTDGGATWTLSSNEALSATDIAVDPLNPAIIYAGNLSRGMFRSTDGGVTWTQLPHPAAHAIRFDPANPSMMYSASVRGLHKTVDGGRSWRELLPMVTAYVSLTVSRSVPATLYAVSEAGALAKSIDAGMTWRTLDAFSDAKAVAVTPENPDTLYVGTERGLFKSVDGGTTFSRSIDADTRAIHLPPGDASTILAATSRGLMKSADAGATWAAVFPSGAVTRLAINSSSPSTMYVVTDTRNLFATSDGGVVWKAIDTDLLPALPPPTLLPITPGDAVDSSLVAPALVSPPEGAVFSTFPRRTTVRWTASPGAVSYLVQVDYRYDNTWQSERGPGQTAGYVATDPEYTFDFVGAQPGRWRVYPMNAKGERGNPSEWRTFRYTR